MIAQLARRLWRGERACSAPAPLSLSFDVLLLSGGRADTTSATLDPRTGDAVRRAATELGPLPLPRLACVMLEVEQVDRRSLLDAVGADPRLAATALALSNYRHIRQGRVPGGSFSELQERDPAAVAGLVLAALLQPVFVVEERYFQEFGRRLFRHSLECAHAAAALADELNIPRERAFAAGLIHDIGKLRVLRAALEVLEYEASYAAIRPAMLAAAFRACAADAAASALADQVPAALRPAACGGDPLGRVVEAANIAAEARALRHHRRLSPDELRMHLRHTGDGLASLALARAFPLPSGRLPPAGGAAL